MAHSHSHSGGGGHDHSHGSSSDLSSLVSEHVLARLAAGGGIAAAGAPAWLASLDRIHARNQGKIDNVLKAAAIVASLAWTADIYRTWSRGESGEEKVGTTQLNVTTTKDHLPPSLPKTQTVRKRPLLRLLRVCFPSVFSTETLLAAVYAALLVVRTATGVAAVAGEARVVEWIIGRIERGAGVKETGHSDHGHDSHDHGHSHGSHSDHSHAGHSDHSHDGHSHSSSSDNSHVHSHGSHSHSASATSSRHPFTELIVLSFRNILFAAVPHVVAGAFLAYVERVLASRFRTRLTNYMTRLYLLGKTNGKPNYYALRGVVDDPGERIARDAERFARGLADVGGCLVGPIVDLVGFSAAAYAWLKGSGAAGDKKVRNPLYYPALLIIILSARHLLPSNPWTLLTSRLRLLESRYAHYHSVISSEAESIALFNPDRAPAREKQELETREGEWTKFEDHVERIRAEEDRWEGWVVQDLWSGLGMLVAGWNVFAAPDLDHHDHDFECQDDHDDHGHSHSHEHSHSHVAHSHDCEMDHDHDAHLHGDHPAAPSEALELASHRAAVFMESRALVAGASDAMARLLHAGRELRELDGTGERVGELLDILEAGELNRGELETQVLEVTEPDAIEFDSVDIVAPVGGVENGVAAGAGKVRDEVLVRGLTLRWERGMNILIRGPNGSGKSSLLRLLAGLWTANGVRSPGFASPDSSRTTIGNTGIYLIPQKVYLVPELDLLSNLLYPNKLPQTIQQLSALKAELQSHLQLLSLQHLIPYLDPSSPLFSTPVSELHLPPSTTHRLSLVRLLLASPAPAFAILDEAVAVLRTREEELGYWTALRRRGISVACVSHGRVWGAEEHSVEGETRFFTHRLRFLGRGTGVESGEGEWVFERIGDGAVDGKLGRGGSEGGAGAGSGSGAVSREDAADEEPSGFTGATVPELLSEFTLDELAQLKQLGSSDAKVAELVRERERLVGKLRELEVARRRKDEIAGLLSGLK